ncbi:arabinogalactan protein 1-like [Sinocyclocheilus anshuiensis]|uniref:arabinogalactan protein 1-like n=1 Tax=Sinocyclocheilus anshuiensis TaxID=1608454 RepID=UPI0007BAD27D|nr:PREDICTED: arabinogalactan protein 1-like [Sinocyclocheilus anshuiensis]
MNQQWGSEEERRDPARASRDGSKAVQHLPAFEQREIHCDPVNFTQPSEAPPFAQSSMALSSVQAPVVPPSAQPLVAPPSVHPLMAPPSVHPLVALPSAQPPVVPPFPPTLVALVSDQESDIFLEDQSPLSPLSPQSSVIDLTDQERSVSPTLSYQDSPLHYVAPIDEVDLQTYKKLLKR